MGEIESECEVETTQDAALGAETMGAESVGTSSDTDKSTANDEDDEKSGKSTVRSVKIRGRPVSGVQEALAALRPHQKTIFTAVWSRHKKLKPDGCFKAIVAFGRLDPDEALCARIDAAHREKAVSFGWQKEGGEFVPLLVTWINGRGWDSLDTEGAVADLPPPRPVLRAMTPEERERARTDPAIQDKILERAVNYGRRVGAAQ